MKDEHRRRSGHLWKTAGQAVLLLLLVLFLSTRLFRSDTEEWAGRVREMGPLPFFTAMTLVPLTGLPASPFYLLSGAIFGEGFAFAAVGASVAANLLLALGLSRAVAWGAPRALRDWARRKRPRRRLNPWLLSLAVRATPGPTVAVKSYLLGFSRVPLAPYLIVSWPMSMGYAVGLILVGDSAYDGNPAGLAAGLLLLLLFAVFVWVLRRRLRREDDDPEDGQDPVSAPS